MASVFCRTLSLFATAVVALTIVLSASAPALAQDTLAPGTVLKDCDTCPELVVVPPGLFVMGLGGKTPREGPPHRVTIAKPFAIGRFEVTFDQWGACQTEGGCSHDPDDHQWGRGTRPVINVDFNRVVEYVNWISTKTGYQYRIPSEAEWEYAHRGGTVTAYPWGDDAGINKANCKDCKSKWSAHSTAPVGSFEPNPFGLYDTVGNAFEWVADCWNPTHEGAPTDGSARTDGDCSLRVMRGGSFYYYKKVARSSYRAKNPAIVKSYWLGFRVARDLP